MRNRILTMIATVAGFGMLMGVLIFGAESLFWLKQGHWPDWTPAEVCGCWAWTDYVGFNKIVNGFLDARLSVATFFTSAAVFGLSCYSFEGA